MDKKLYAKLFNVTALDALAVVENNTFNDTQAGTILARHLEHIDPTIFETQYPDLAALTAGFEVDNSGGVASTITSLKVDESGEFRQAGDKDSNKGKITLHGAESQIPVFEYEATSEWSDTQIQRADQQGVNLVNRLLTAHDKIYKRDIDRVSLIGLEDVPLSRGLLNTTAFTSTAAGDNIEDMTPKQRYEAIADLINDQHSSVNNIMLYKANRVIMPVRVRNALNVQYEGITTPMSVYNVLRQTFPEVELIETFRADTLANGGNLSVSATLAVSNHGSVGKIRVPEALTIGPATS